jgi:hypothetical protein
MCVNVSEIATRTMLPQQTRHRTPKGVKECGESECILLVDPALVVTDLTQFLGKAGRGGEGGETLLHVGVVGLEVFADQGFEQLQAFGRQTARCQPP